MSKPKPESKSDSSSGSSATGGLRLAKLIAEKSNLLEEAGIRSGQAEIEWMLSHLLDLDRLHLYLDGEKLLTPELLNRLDALVEKRLTRYPLQFILNESWFYGRKFYVNQHVMAPTPETERLVELALGFCEFRKYDKPRILDLGTGSGVIALSMAAELEDCEVTALDISPKALEVAKKNAAIFGVDTKLDFRLSDFWAAVKPDEKFDLILSNPPYIAEPDYAALDPEVLADPKIAMTAGDEGMDCIRDLVAQAADYLAPKGKIIFEIGYNQAEMVARLTDGDIRYQSYSVIKDLNDINRCIILGCDQPDA